MGMERYLSVSRSSSDPASIACSSEASSGYRPNTPRLQSSALAGALSPSDSSSGVGLGKRRKSGDCRAHSITVSPNASGF